MKNTNKDAIDLVKAVYLNSRSLDIFVDTLIKQVELFGKKISPQASDADLKKILMSDQFLQEFATQLNRLFTDKEIAELLKIYQSDVMNRFLIHSAPVFDSLYAAMRKETESLMFEQ